MPRTLASVPPLDDPAYTTPIYHRPEVARLIGIRPNTLRNWAKGYIIKRPGRYDTSSKALITTIPTANGRGPSIPFVGLAESYMLAAFRQAGVPMQRIRPALRRLEEQIGLPQALASEQLMTDGAEVLWEYRETTDNPLEKEVVDELVVLRNGQGVFREVVKDYLVRVSYEDGWAKVIHLPTWKNADIFVDPRINGGKPTVARRGIRVSDIIDRSTAGESSEDLAYDYELEISEVESIISGAA
ncbi:MULTISPECIES: DUF433 domain-containing protein [unclassified Nocardiopsis]|uniref:DUF433 domain-containing protein n=1 Tax=unclassified Nocardiopsis TaxID=2649073 RepID=UPI00093C98AB|nr:DUF433 domain-containing protein [Nocardiopsis sp. TSRI0078]